MENEKTNKAGEARVLGGIMGGGLAYITSEVLKRIPNSGTIEQIVGISPENLFDFYQTSPLEVTALGIAIGAGYGFLRQGLTRKKEQKRIIKSGAYSGLAANALAYIALKLWDLVDLDVMQGSSPFPIP